MIVKLAAVLFFLPLAAQAYVRTISETGRPLYWANSSVGLRVNPSNSSGLSEASVTTMLNQAFTAWKSVPGTQINPSVAVSVNFAANTAVDGLNTIYFASRSGRRMDYGVIALTEVFYYLSDGRIAETDMSFNDNQFLFTANAGDTGKTIGGRTAIYLRDVATHEAGHVFGIDHSSVNLSSMIYTAFSGQFFLGGDDQSAISSLYPGGGARGAIEASVQGTNGGIFGAHIEAINLATGKVEAGALSNSDGSVRIGDLPPGKYSVLIEPYAADTSSISSYFQNVDHHFCSGANFRRRFFGTCGSAQAGVVEVANGSTTNIGTLSPSCAQIGNPQGSPLSLASARDLGGDGASVFGTLRPGETHYYRVTGVNGDLVARAIAYSIYSPLDLSVRILTSGGNSVAGASSTDNIEAPMPGGYTNYDSLAQGNNLQGDYVIAVSASSTRVPSSSFSAGYDLLDRDGHYLLALGVNGSYGALASGDMSACVTLNNRAQSATWRAPASSKTEDEKKSSGCGTLGPIDDNPFSGGLMQLLVGTALIQACILLRRRASILVRIRR
ncbi:MAG: matrixin family metalloprotease [Bacteriovoracia bacterium]